MSEGINTHWLMHYRVVALVNQCRRLIRDEFGTRLSLTDPQLRQELDRFAARSQSRELARLMDDIAREAGAAEAAQVGCAGKDGAQTYVPGPASSRARLRNGAGPCRVA